MAKWKLIIIMGLLLPMVMATICEERLDNGSTCLMLTPEIVCSTYTYDIFTHNGTTTAYNQSLTNLNGSIYYFNFTNTTGEYIVRLCDGTTREFRVTESYDTKFQAEEEARMSIMIAIILIGVTLAIFYMAIQSQSKAFQIGFVLLGFLFVVADLFFAARLTEQISPAYSGIIHNLDTMYLVGLYILVFLMTLGTIILFVWVINFLKDMKKRKQDREVEEWMAFK